MSIAEEREAVEKRRQAAEESRANRAKQKEANQEQTEEDNAALDNLLEKLRNGDSVGRKARRARKSTATRQTTAPLTLNTDILLTTKSGDETVDIARDMLMRLKSDGFDALTPSTPTATSMRRSRRKRDSEGVAALAALGESISPGGTLREDSESSTAPSIILDSIEEHPSPATG